MLSARMANTIATSEPIDWICWAALIAGCLIWALVADFFWPFEFRKKMIGFFILTFLCEVPVVYFKRDKHQKRQEQTFLKSLRQKQDDNHPTLRAVESKQWIK